MFVYKILPYRDLIDYKDDVVYEEDTLVVISPSVAVQRLSSTYGGFIQIWLDNEMKEEFFVSIKDDKSLHNHNRLIIEKIENYVNLEEG